MELRQLRQLLVLAETLNFHRAAERLHMAQPPLSTSIKKLESELGLLLFERLPSGLQLTAAGQTFLGLARRTLFHADELRRTARELAHGEQGQLRLGCVGSASHGLLPQILREYRKRFPQVGLSLEESSSSDLLRRLEAHTLDVAFVRFPVLLSSPASITLLKRERMMLAVPADSMFAGLAEVALQVLDEQPFIIYSPNHSPTMHLLTLHAFQQMGVRPRIVQEAVQVQTMLGLVEGGLGLALVPESAARLCGEAVRLVPLAAGHDVFQVGTALAVMPETLPPSARHFVEQAFAVAGIG